MRTVTQRTSFARMASKIWILYSIKQPKYWQECLVSFFLFLWSVQVRVSYTASRFIFSADSGIDETRRLAAFFGTRSLNLLYLLGSEFSRHPRGLRIRVWVFETPRGSDFFRVWGLSFRDTPCILDQFNFPVIASIYESTQYVLYVFYCNCNRYRKLVDILKMSHLSFERCS